MKLLVLVILSVGLAQSATIQFVTPPTNGDNGTLNGYAGASVDNIETLLICDDHADVTYIPSGPWQFTETSLSGDLNTTLFLSLNTYTVVATLAWEALADPDNIATYQYAIWQATNNSVAPYRQSDVLLALARSQPADQTILDSFRIYSPIGDAKGNQEFVGFANGTEAPEPNTLLAVPGGLLIVVRRFLRWSRRRA